MTAHIQRVQGVAGSIKCDVYFAFEIASQIGQVIHPTCPVDVYDVVEESVQNPPTFPTAIYVICDREGQTLYVGQCNRTTSGVNDRLRNHGALTEDADHVIIIPLNDFLEKETVNVVELAFIGTLQPPYNSQGMQERQS